MQISIENNKICFKSSYKRMCKNGSPIIGSDCYFTSTNFFRGDFPWDSFFDFIINKNKNLPKVNTYSLASSDGSEALSIALILITKAKEEAQKYFPIIAVDFDNEVAQQTKNGYIDLSANDEIKINKFTGNKLNKYFERTNHTFLTDELGWDRQRILLTTFKIKPELLEKIKFVTEELNTYVDKIPSEETNLIFCRNCWDYMKKISNELAEKLSEKIGVNSYLTVGNSDGLTCPMYYKNCYGFSMSQEFHNVLDKSGNNLSHYQRLLLRQPFKDDII